MFDNTAKMVDGIIRDKQENGWDVKADELVAIDGKREQHRTIDRS